MENDLSKKKCVPCEGGTPPLTKEEIGQFQNKINNSWELIEGDKIEREWKFEDFKETIEFVNKVADISEEEGHHPDISVHYNKVKLTLWTHAIGGLHENDFILASKINNIK